MSSHADGPREDEIAMVSDDQLMLPTVTVEETPPVSVWSGCNHGGGELAGAETS